MQSEISEIQSAYIVHGRGKTNQWREKRIHASGVRGRKTGQD